MVPAFPLIAPQANGYVEYANARFGFRLMRPAFMEPQRPPDNGDGREFRGNGAQILAFGTNNLDGKTAKGSLAELKRSLAKRGVRPTLAVSKGGWYAASWVGEGATVRYVKAFVNPERTISLFFTYPVRDKARMDSVLTRVVRSFRPL